MLTYKNIGGDFYVTGKLCDIDKPNYNGRIYTMALWENVLSDNVLQESIKKGQLLGTIGTPKEIYITPMEASHFVTSIEVKNGSVYGTAKVLDTPYGRSLKTLLECSVDNSLSSLYLALRGFSESVLEDTISGYKKVPDNAYHFISFDICMDYDIKKENGNQ